MLTNKELSYIVAIRGDGKRRKSYLYSASYLLLFLLILIPYASTSNWDPYEIIGVKRDANLDQIKKAYRELARKLHPDKSNLSKDEAAKKFIELNKAFSLLKDPKKRSRFDRNGEIEENRSPRGYPSLMDRVLWRFVDITAREPLPTIAILVVCAIITSLFLYQTPSPSFMKNDPDTPKDYNVTQGRKNSTIDSELKIIELKAETYNGMIRLLKPGHRTIVLLTDCESKDKLLTQFKRAVWPFRRNKSLLFGYLCLDKNLKWYRSLLQEVLGIDDLEVNKKNCIGTVLSLNGFKKYFRLYHAKHHEVDYYDNDTNNDGSFLGFNDSEDESIESGLIHGSHADRNGSLGVSVFTVDNLLDRLPIWLDKVFDGLTKRYFLGKWPEEIE